MGRLIYISLFFIFLSFSTNAQNFMMNMDIHEVMSDTTNIYPCTRVVWGIKRDTIAFLWQNHYPIYFVKRPYYKKNTRGTKKIMARYVDLLSKEQNTKAILRDLFYNQWEELYLITIYANPGLIIYITRLDGKYPHYMFIMTPN